MYLSKRLKNTPASPIRKLEGMARQTKTRGIKIYHLNIGQPDLAAPAPMVNWLKRAKIHHLAYTESQGNRQLIEAIIKYYRQLGAKDITADHVIITLGGSEAIQWSLFATGESGAEALVFEPFYTNVEGYARLADVKLKPITCTIHNGFQLPSNQKIAKKITSKTRAIYLCNPNNPTGTYYPLAEVKRLYQLCLKKRLYLIVDEVYRDFIYQRTNLKTALTLENKKAAGWLIVIDSFSKRYSLCGIRVGFIISRHKELIKNVLKLGQARLSAGDLDQQIASRFPLVAKSYLTRVNKEYQQRRDLVARELKKIPGAVFTTPAGAFYFMVKLPVGNAEKFCEWLIKNFHYHKQTVMLAPATGFYLSKGKGLDEVRLAYVLKRAELKKAMEILRKAVWEWQRLT